MKKFAIEIHGLGFPIVAEDGTTMDGFVVTVFVEAEDETDACDIALREIVESDEFQAGIGVILPVKTGRITSALSSVNCSSSRTRLSCRAGKPGEQQ